MQDNLSNRPHLLTEPDRTKDFQRGNDPRASTLTERTAGLFFDDQRDTHMNEITNLSDIEGAEPFGGKRSRTWPWVLGVAVVGIAGLLWVSASSRETARPMAPPPAPVTVSQPLLRDVDTQLGFLGQFSAVDRIEIRAQVGGTLTEIDFKDGQIVHKGDLLFVIDPRPYEIKLAQAKARLKTATSHRELASAELVRAQALKRSNFGTAENVDQRAADQSAAEAAIDDAKAQIRDAELDLEYSRITAPFTGRIGAHLVSVGGLIAGSRAATSPTTLLTTLVSLDPIYLDFDMSESDYLAFSRERARLSGQAADQVAISLSDENRYGRVGSLDFVDNALDRSSGTIHARATVPNADLFLVPGEFARIRLAVAPPAPTLLLPDAAVLLDQSQHIVMTVAADGTVAPKPVEIGDLRGGLRVIRSGITPKDRVIIDGLIYAMPGAKVAPKDGAIRYDAAADHQG
jgi:RND family efflux transporter MFP subunit